MRDHSLTLSIRSFIRRLIGLIIILVLAFQAYVYSPVLTSPADGYQERKGKIQSVNITRRWQEADSNFQELDLLSTSGLKVQVTIRTPIEAQGPLPVALLLGGIGTGRDACRIIPRIQHVRCISVSYPYYGEKIVGVLDFFYSLRDIQQGVKDTPPALLLVLDYVLSQAYSDIRQVELLGVSLGSYFISIPAAIDQRVTRVWIAHGAAEPVNAMIHYSERQSGKQLLKRLFTYYIGYAIGSQHVAPEKWVGRIAPRPVVLINAKHDQTFPASSVAALHNAAGQPKEIIWTKGAHVTPGRKEIVEQISNIILSRIEGDFLKRRSND
jgi:hypothetical protein